MKPFHLNGFDKYTIPNIKHFYYQKFNSMQFSQVLTPLSLGPLQSDDLKMKLTFF